MELLDIIKKYARQRGLTLRQVNDKAGLGTNAIYRWKNQKPSFEKINSVAKVLGVSTDCLLENDLPDNAIPIDPKEMKPIPVIGTIACGQPIFADQNIESYQYLPMWLLPKDYKHVFFLKCKGDSMEPTIRDGSLVLIHEQPDVENDEIAAVLIDGESTLKRIKKLDKQILLMPDNSNYSPIILNSHKDNRIIGKAIQVLNNL